MSGKILGLLSIVFLVFFTENIYGQHTKKVLSVKRVESAPKIDGILDDAVWKDAPVAGDFVQFEPYNGKKPSEKTEVRIVYNDDAIYFGAMMYESNPDSIYTIMTKRDAGFDGMADVFVISISTFNDGINSNLFIVSAAGVQSDIKGSANDMDANWDVVWESAVNVTDSGWIAEIEIPYSALRFSKEEVQTWGINFFRTIQRLREGDSWNWINNEIEGFTNQQGEITNLVGIKPPLRLSFTPYASGYVEKNSENNYWDKGLRGGMDLKWGINEGYTLDMMLIPDFSQVQSDDLILNLTAFETKYEERRPFFTEGTELFNKGNIFYSKRIGSQPKDIWNVYDVLEDSEEVVENPAETQIINATKITGRSKNGLGLGFFNAMTLKSEAVIRDTFTGSERTYTTQPFTNYNILVADQNLKNNSYVSLINTNMIMADNNNVANVTAGEFRLRNKKQSYQFGGTVGLSQKYRGEEENSLGYKYNFEFAKTAGKVRFSLFQDLVDDKFDPNDMGFQLFNNYVETGGDLSFQTLQPFGKFINFDARVDSKHQMTFDTKELMYWQIGMNSSVTFQSYWDIGIFFDAYPLGQYDFYEARKEGQVYKIDPSVFGGIFMGSDRRKKFYFRLFAMTWRSNSEYKQRTYRGRISPTLRATDKLTFSLSVSPAIQNNDIGYANEVSDTVVMGLRDRKTITNTLTTEYSITDKMSMSMRVRHYWSSAKYKQFFNLEQDGSLSDRENYDENHDINFNAFNVDFVYTWRFAPGSDVLLIWKNSIYSFEDYVIDDYFDNINTMFKEPQTNMLSIKVLYYLDYQYLKRKHK